MAGIDPKRALHVLCLLTLKSEPNASAIGYMAGLDPEARTELLALADAHHVVIRALERILSESGDLGLKLWATAAIASEQERIRRALPILSDICRELEAAGCPVTVMKSLDHWPDLGNDLDLFTTADQQQVVAVMTERFGALIEARSWGDRLANKWNFRVPDLRESVEVHARRLGQTGEHTELARRFISRRVPREVGGHTFLVPAPEERIIEATLQRMYRHFYFRVCDILDTAALVDAGALDYAELQRASEQSCIWPGVATFLRVVSDWIERYRGAPLALPVHVLSAARFGGDTICAKRKFLRVPILPHGAQLYTAQVMRTASRGELTATLRLSLLPPLASAAALAFRLTGSDKGVW
jgi:Uncharacterised nucleotidyltransferase